MQRIVAAVLAGLVLTSCTPKAATDGKAPEPSNGPPRIATYGVVRTTPPSYTLAPDGSALSLIFADFTYDRPAGKPPPKTMPHQTWRIALVQPPAEAADVKVEIRGFGFGPAAVGAKLTVKVGEESRSFDIAGAPGDEAASPPYHEFHFTLPAKSETLLLDLAVSVAHPEAEPPEQVSLGVDTVDISFGPARK